MKQLEVTNRYFNIFLPSFCRRWSFREIDSTRLMMTVKSPALKFVERPLQKCAISSAYQFMDHREDIYRISFR